MRAEEIQGLMEAYSKVNATPEILSEEVLDLSDEDLEGIELIEMTMEEIEQLDEAGQPGAAIAQQAKAQRVAAQQQVRQRLGSGGDIKLRDANPLRPNKPFSNPLSGSALPKQSNRAFGTQLNGRQGVVVKNAVGQGRGFAGAADTVNVAGQTLYKAKRGKDVVYLQGKGKPKLFEPKGNKPAKPETPTPAPTKPGNTGAPTPAPTKPGNTTGGKPTTPPAAPQKPQGSAMDQWRAANPKLAAAADEKARIRGTSQTDNPLMKDMRSKMSMTPSVQSPTLAKDLGGGSGNQSLLDNPNASKAATPKPAAAPKPTPAPKTTTTTGNSKDKDKEDLFAHVDIFDLVKGHLLDEGYADSEEGAMVIMVNMSEEWRKSILEAHGVELDEAQRARENPEDHDKEEKRKYEPVRGERTPMPPRGDKRREEFEKWYAKQMGR